ncbi:MAG: DUF2029 domain-containing protein, partial [Thermoleophilia bacterium]|nr:DUF2029 domain-containing protein [Thermoleophilia bacterium]
DRTMGRLRAIRDGLLVAGLLFGGYLFVVVAPQAQTVGFDAYAYWSLNLDLEYPYVRVVGELGAFPYTPVAARAFAPASLLPWPAFWFLWSAVLLGTIVWLGRRGWPDGAAWTGPLMVLAFPPVAVELYHGNVHLLIAAAIALGFRYPAAWSFVLLTKVTPGIGLLWFAVRREWRPLIIVGTVTGLLVAVSLLVDARFWAEWINVDLLVSLQRPPTQPQIAIPLLPRFLAAALLVTWGARTDRRWTVPAAATLALPVLWFAGLSILAAIPAVDWRQRRDADRAARAAAEATEPTEAAT